MTQPERSYNIVKPDEVPKRTHNTKKLKYDDFITAAFLNAPNLIELIGVSAAAVVTVRRNYSDLQRTIPVVTERPDLPEGELTEYRPHRIHAFTRMGSGPDAGRRRVFIQAVPVYQRPGDEPTYAHPEDEPEVDDGIRAYDQDDDDLDQLGNDDDLDQSGSQE